MRLHVVGLPWTELRDEYLTCAYTQKIVKFARMMTDHGWDVTTYTPGERGVEGADHVEVITSRERERWFGVHDPQTTWGHITWDSGHDAWVTLNANAAAHIEQRADRRDLLLLSAGLAHAPLRNWLPALTACEPFVGYKGILLDKCAYESHAWRHHVYGLNHLEQGRMFDTVIPNYFDADDFHTGTRGDYCLFVGRLIANKGPHVAAAVAEAAGRELLVAGPGMRAVESLPGGGERIHGDGIVIEGAHVRYIGVLDKHARAEAMAQAHCLLAPTLYIEPFGGVAVEAMLSGCPAVTTNFGAFTETVVEGVSGFRFSTLAEGKRAVERAGDLDPYTVQEYALDRFSLEAVAPMFARWFRQLDTLWENGWYELDADDVVTSEVAA